jgi:hypothetical protein
MWQTKAITTCCWLVRNLFFEGTILGKVMWFTTIINPDRLIDKFTGKEGLFENSPFDERTDKSLLKQKCH